MANKIILCQTGARHRYLIPKVLEDDGLLYRLYTDSTAYSLLGRIASFINKSWKCPLVIQRLSKRIPPIAKEKLYSTDVLFFKEQILKLCTGDSLKLRYAQYNGFEKKYISWGVGDADCVYSMYIENFEFLKFAKAQGLKVVVDIYETPMTYKYLIEEIESHEEYAFLDYKKKAFSYSHEVRMHYMEDLLALADYYTIPSQFVIKSMSVFRNFDKSKVLYLPYASSITVEEYSYTPKKHRLIWVGNDPVRKGLLYCAKAADILRRKYPDLDFRVIGNVDEQIKNTECFQSLHFLGVLNKSQLQEEYRNAEAYVFPTLFEGFAGTIIEAASCGCPIITTECAGTDVDEFPALYIPTKDVEAIVNSVTRIFEDSNLRDKLSHDVYAYSSRLRPETYAEKLVSYLKTV